ncbi:MAG: hypothetical protein HY231_16010 [Acidobacteria bacterium]|nr:hypothetical protein [Acidobacteriota bacterium]
MVEGETTKRLALIFIHSSPKLFDLPETAKHFTIVHVVSLFIGTTRREVSFTTYPRQRLQVEQRSKNPELLKAPASQAAPLNTAKADCRARHSLSSVAG